MHSKYLICALCIGFMKIYDAEAQISSAVQVNSDELQDLEQDSGVNTLVMMFHLKELINNVSQNIGKVQTKPTIGNVKFSIYNKQPLVICQHGSSNWISRYDGLNQKVDTVNATAFNYIYDGLNQKVDTVNATAFHFIESNPNRRMEKRHTKEKRVELLKTQNGGCGGIVVSKKGYIFYTFNPSLNNSIRCVWTVRANVSSQVAFKLLDYDFNCKIKSLVSLMSVDQPYSPNLHPSNYTKTLLPGDGGEHIINGPLVIVAFSYDPSATEPTTCSSAGFQLKFEGRSTERTDLRKYSHFHYTEKEGSLSYPANGQNYSNTETLTFVINAKATPIYIHLNYLNTEVTYDKLWILTENQRNNTSTPVFYTSPIGNINGYSGSNGNVNADIRPPITTSLYVVIFQSDGSNVHNGFGISWRKL